MIHSRRGICSLVKVAILGTAFAIPARVARQIRNAVVTDAPPVVQSAVAPVETVPVGILAAIIIARRLVGVSSGEFQP